MNRRWLGLWLRTILAIASVVGLSGCTDADAEAKGEYFSCSKPADCLAGYSCVCGYCVQGQPPADLCPADTTTDANDATAGDSSLGDAADSTDVQAADTASGTDTAALCDLVTWQGCEDGKGCFFLQGQPTCKTHGNVGYQSACNPTSTTPQCGKAQVAGQPAKLLCDVVDKKCYPTCNCDSEQTCANGMTCYCLTDAGGANLPGGAGICAP